MTAAASAIRERARQVFGDDDLAGDRFERKIAALIRYTGAENQPLEALTDDELDDVDIALDRVEAGRLTAHMRADGTFEMRFVSQGVGGRR